MNPQDNNFNYKIIFAALVAVIVGILIAFYYSYAQSKNQMSFLEQEKSLLVKDLTLMKAEVVPGHSDLVGEIDKHLYRVASAKEKMATIRQYYGNNGASSE